MRVSIGISRAESTASGRRPSSPRPFSRLSSLPSSSARPSSLPCFGVGLFVFFGFVGAGVSPLSSFFSAGRRARPDARSRAPSPCRSAIFPSTTAHWTNVCSGGIAVGDDQVAVLADLERCRRGARSRGCARARRDRLERRLLGQAAAHREIRLDRQVHDVAADEAAEVDALVRAARSRPGRRRGRGSRRSGCSRRPPRQYLVLRAPVARRQDRNAPARPSSSAIVQPSVRLR